MDLADRFVHVRVIQRWSLFLSQPWRGWHEHNGLLVLVDDEDPNVRRGYDRANGHR